MEDIFYDNLLRATDNTNDITNEKYGTITKLDNQLANVKEVENGIEHSKVPIMNGVTLKLGDKVILGFIGNSIYNPIVLGTVSRKTNDSYTKEEIDQKIEDIISGGIELEEYMKKTEYASDLMNQTDTSQFLRALDNIIISITGRGDDF